MNEGISDDYDRACEAIDYIHKKCLKHMYYTNGYFLHSEKNMKSSVYEYLILIN